jgi:NAD(P)-dependent dehydrogenase (short-subunit alcohol dehydrogenase family)
MSAAEKVALVTRASRGIGAGLVRHFLAYLTTRNSHVGHSKSKGALRTGGHPEIQAIVAAVLYLEDAAFVTGKILHVDGGAHSGRW